MATITTIQVFRALGIEPTSSQAWSVGARMAHLYTKEFGVEPPKENRPKTTGAGSHCFAIYPAHWQTIIEGVIKSVTDCERSQTDLFATTGEPQ
jgi:hypothetical protein